MKAETPKIAEGLIFLISRNNKQEQNNNTPTLGTGWGKFKQIHNCDRKIEKTFTSVRAAWIRTRANTRTATNLEYTLVNRPRNLMHSWTNPG